MREKHSEPRESKGICYEALEEYAREKIRQHLQYLLEDEVTEWLGREKSERKDNALEQPVDRDGYGKTRRFTMSVGTVKIRRPRVRDLGERFISKVLPFFKRQTKQVRDLIPELYLHALASGDFEMALRGLLGKGRRYRPVRYNGSRRSAGEYEQWKSEPVEEKESAYLWTDGIYLKRWIGKQKAALLVVIGVKRDGSKGYLALEPGYRESKESWGEVLRQLKKRGLKSARLFVGDGNLGLWAAVGGVIYPHAQEQLCWNHKMLKSSIRSA